MTDQLEVLDAELVEEPTVASLSPAVRPVSALVSPAAPTEEIERAFRAYSALCERLLTPDDYQQIGDRQFRKKSAWRKLAVAFGVSCEITNRDYERNDAGRIIRAEVLVRATAPNGRYMDGVGACDAFERCCPTPCPKRTWGKHTCCLADCTGGRHFSNPQHDIPATAATRATNRACSDLFGMGEVSAEEIVGDAPTSRAENGNPTRVASLRVDPGPTAVGVMRTAELVERIRGAGLTPENTVPKMRAQLSAHLAGVSQGMPAPETPPAATGGPLEAEQAPPDLVLVGDQVLCYGCGSPIPESELAPADQLGVEDDDGRVWHASCQTASGGAGG